MNPSKAPNIITRRSFLRDTTRATLGTWAAASTIRDLRLINSAVALEPITGYKALVCLFLAGGNDANNWIVPTDATTYAQYTDIRDNLAIPSASLLPLHNVGTSGAQYTDAAGHTYGFHPSCPQLRTLFGEDKLAVLFNVGTLVRPTTRAQYTGSNTKFYQPPQLFSHSDQVTQWQTSIPDQPPTTGWGGRVADLINATANPSGQISMSVSLNGANTFEAGNLISQYHVSTSGAVTMSSVAGSRLKTIQDILAVADTNLQRTAYASVTNNAIETGELLNAKIAATAMASDNPPGTWVWTTPFPTSSLGSQLKMIARIIQARGPTAFDMLRQVFYCSAGGYDTHTSQVLVNGVNNPVNPAGAHYGLLKDVNDCVFAFQRAMVQLGVDNQVTLFTASDFSRTLPTNSQGSDHGWGSHHIIVGAAVAGGQTYGKLPTFAINGPDDTGLGRWIPTLAVDQYSATLAKWYGVSSGSEMQAIFPNLTRFSTPDLGFMT